MLLGEIVIIKIRVILRSSDLLEDHSDIGEQSYFYVIRWTDSLSSLSKASSSEPLTEDWFASVTVKSKNFSITSGRDVSKHIFTFATVKRTEVVEITNCLRSYCKLVTKWLFPNNWKCIFLLLTHQFEYHK